MRDEAFGKVFNGVARLCGLDPARLTPELAESIAGWIEQRVGQAWESFPWPELCPVEERFYAALYDLGKTYVNGDGVRVMDDNATVADGFPHPCAYYTLLNATSQATAPGTNEAVWATVSPARLIDLAQPEGWDAAGVTPTPMGEVLSVHRQDPRKVRAPRPVSFRLSGDRVCLDPCAPNSVFVEFRLRPPAFTSVAWDSTKSYALGEVVYYNGECYVAGAITPVAYLTVSGAAQLNGISPNGRYPRTADVVNGKAVYWNQDNHLAFFYTGSGWTLLSYLNGAPVVIPSYFQNFHASDDPGSAGGAYSPQGSPLPTGTLTVVLTTATATPNCDANWTRVRVPHVLANYARRAVRADYLADDGQDDKAFAQERRATDWLDEQFINVTAIQRQTARYAVTR